MTPDGWQPSLGAWLEADGACFRVWAPEARRVELVLRGDPPETVAPTLARDDAGYWTARAPGVGAGTGYGYLLDGAGPFPDPASRSQPGGVHGLSQLVAPAAFSWQDEAWKGAELEGLVVYELHVGAFTAHGTFQGVVERLPELRDLGATAVELMPVAAFAGRWNWGYDGASLFAPAPGYGGPEGLRHLVDAAHSMGLAVILDVVYNHTGPEGSYLERFSPHYLSRAHRTPWGPGMNLDGEGSGPVRELFIENACHWVGEYHIDGLRVDSCRSLVDTSPRHLLAEMQARVREAVAPRRVLMVAEDSRNMVKIVEPEERGGWGFDAIWADDLHHQVRVALAGDRDGYYRDFTGAVPDVARTVSDGWFFRGQYSEHFDEARGTDPLPVPPRHFVVYVQNHDQVGNRARGERLHHEVSPDRWRAASALVLLAPETPLLFMGQEWAASTPFQYFTDHAGRLGQQMSRARRRELQAFEAFADPGMDIPDPQEEDTFRRSGLRWDERLTGSHAGCLRLTRALLALRRDLRLGTVERWEYRVSHDRGVIVNRVRRPGLTEVVVLVALGPVAAGQVLAAAEEGPELWTVLLSTEDEAFVDDPRPAQVLASTEVPRVRFARAGGVVLVRRPGPEGEDRSGGAW